MRKTAYILGGSLASLSLYLFYPLPTPPTDYDYERFKSTRWSVINPHYIPDIPEKIGIIGGGVSGLIAAKTFSQQGFDVEVLDQNNEIGGIWAKNYYGVGIQGPFWHYSLVDFGWESGVEAFPKLPALQNYLKNYVKHFGLGDKVKLQHTVEKIEQKPNSTWTVHVNHQGKTEQKHYDFLIMATGVNNKHIPDVPGKESFKGQILHNSEVTSPDVLKGKNVVVVGGSKGAWDMLHRAEDEAKSTTSLMVSSRHAIPVIKRWGVTSLSFYTTRFPSFFFMNIDPKGTELVYKYGWFLKKIFYNWLASYNDDIPDFLCGNNNLDSTYPIRVNVRDDKAIDGIRKGRIKLVRGKPEEIKPDGIIAEGTFIPADLIIFATGGERRLFDLGPKTGEFWLYRNCIKPGVQNLAFLGHAETIYVPLYDVITCCWLIDVIRGQVKLPIDLKGEVEWLKKKIETKYGNYSGHSNGWASAPLIDIMLKDMGINTRRRKNYYEHWFSPILPEDYLGVVTHRK